MAMRSDLYFESEKKAYFMCSLLCFLIVKRQRKKRNHVQIYLFVFVGLNLSFIYVIFNNKLRKTTGEF